MLRFTKEALASLRRTVVYVLQIEITALLLYTYVIFPGCRMVLSYVMRSQGYAYFIGGNIGSGFQNIWIVLTLIFIGLFLGSCFFIEIVLLLAAVRQEGFHGLACRFRHALKVIFSPFGALLVVYTFFAGIMIHLNLIIRLAQSISDAEVRNFIVNQPLLMVLAGFALLLFITISLRSLFVYPLVAGGDNPVRNSFGVSARLMKKRYFSTISKFLFVNLAVLFLFALFYLLVMITILLVLYHTQSIELRYAVRLTAMDAANRALIFLYTVVLVSVNMVVVTILRRQYSGETAEGVKLVSSGTTARKNMALHRVILAGMVCLLIALILVQDDFLHNFRLRTGYNPGDQKPEIIAHRGHSFAAPENTLAALQSAIDEIADSAEVDARMTKDGELILMHDRSFLRTCGVNAYVSDLTYRQIAGFDAGSWFSPEFAGERIPTIQEALEFCKGRLRLMVEIKSETGQEHDIALKVAQAVEEAGMQRDIIVASFSPAVLEEVKQLNHAVATCLILRFAYGNISGIEYVDMFSIELKYASKTVIRNIRRSGKAVAVWTVNDSRNLSFVNDLRVDAVITDRPVRARTVLYEDAVPGFLYKNITALLRRFL